ncbi:polysaccharide deacetylase family protein [Candidatus Saccharibacteria bacterium]|nr:polysaccharide deacetylase family protein [Candidatus Saccharibacteria bacterium]
MASAQEQPASQSIAMRVCKGALLIPVAVYGGFLAHEVESHPGDRVTADYWIDAGGRAGVDMIRLIGDQTASVLGINNQQIHSGNQTPIQRSAAASPLPSPSKSEKSSNATVAGYVGLYDHEGVTTKQVNDIEHCGNVSKTKVLLTFDDKASPKRIKEFDEALKRLGAGAIFFPNKDFVNQASVDMLRSDGFYVGNHTGSHPDLTKMKTTEEIQNAIKSGGIANLFRPPFGATYKKEDGKTYVDGRVISAAEGLGKRVCNWSIDTNDWTGKSTEEIVKSLVNVQGGDVVLLHLPATSNSLEALPEIKKAILAKGLSLCPPAKEPTTATIPEVTCS